jgi:hypothetical protein
MISGLSPMTRSMLSGPSSKRSTFATTAPWAIAIACGGFLPPGSVSMPLPVVS